jgi:hypothetical protein
LLSQAHRRGFCSDHMQFKISGCTKPHATVSDWTAVR